MKLKTNVFKFKNMRDLYTKGDNSEKFNFMAHMGLVYHLKNVTIVFLSLLVAITIRFKNCSLQKKEVK